MRTSKGKLAREIKQNLFHRWVEAKQKLYMEYLEAYSMWEALTQQAEGLKGKRLDKKKEAIAKAHGEGAAIFKVMQRPYVAREWL